MIACVCGVGWVLGSILEILIKTDEVFIGKMSIELCRWMFKTFGIRRLETFTASVGEILLRLKRFVAVLPPRATIGFVQPVQYFCSSRFLAGILSVILLSNETVFFSPSQKYSVRVEDL